MKKFNTILTMFATAVCLAGCGIDIDGYKTVDPENGEELKVTVRADEPIILQEKNSTGTAIGLEWTPGSNFGTGNAISYTLEIDRADGKWEDCYNESLGKRVYSRNVTVEELNSILTDLGSEYGSAGDYKGRIKASVTDHSEMDQLCEFMFSATTYSPAPGTLYIIGDVTDGGWNVSEATRMVRTSGGIFIFEGMMEAGEEFRFISTPGNEWPAYIKAAGSQTGITYAESAPDDTDDINFSISAKSEYRITVNLLEMTVTTENIMTETLYLIGDATPGGWATDKASVMTMTGNGIFTWTGTLTTAGEGFKFITTRNFWPGYVKANDNPDDWTLRYSETELPGNEDRKFKVDETAEYRVDVNLFDMTVSVFRTGDAGPDEPGQGDPLYEALWLIGSASPVGWSLDDAAANDAVRMNPSTDDPDIYSWTGELMSGELKVSCDLQRDFMGKWYMPLDNGSPMNSSGSESIQLVDSSEENAVDYKWNVSAGNYTITINVETNTMTVTRN